MPRSSIVLQGEYHDVPGDDDNIQVYLKSMTHGEFTFQMHRGSDGLEFDTTINMLKQGDPDESEPIAHRDGHPIYKFTPSNVEEIVAGLNNDSLCAHRIHYDWGGKGGMHHLWSAEKKRAYIIAKVKGLNPIEAVDALKEDKAVATS